MAIDLIKFRDFAYLKNGEVKKEGDDGWKDGNCGDGTLYVVGYKDEGLGGSDPEFRIELNDIGDIHNLLDVTIDTNNHLYLTFAGQPFGTGYEIPTSGGDGDFDVSKLHFYFDNGTDPNFGKRFYLKYGDITVTDPISFDAKMNDDGQHLDFYIGGALTKSVLLPTGSQSGVTSVIRRAGEVQVKTIDEVFNELYPNHNIDDYKGKVLTTKTKLLVDGEVDPYLIPTYLPIPTDDTPGGDSGEIQIIAPDLQNVYVQTHTTDTPNIGSFDAVAGAINSYNLNLDLQTIKGDDGESLEFDWQGTYLGVRRAGSDERYQYVDLKGQDGTGVAIKPSEAECVEVGDGYIDEYGHLQMLSNFETRLFKDCGEIRGPKGRDGVDGTNGVDGKSVYAYAQKNQHGIMSLFVRDEKTGGLHTITLYAHDEMVNEQIQHQLTASVDEESTTIVIADGPAGPQGIQGPAGYSVESVELEVTDNPSVYNMYTTINGVKSLCGSFTIPNGPVDVDHDIKAWVIDMPSDTYTLIVTDDARWMNWLRIPNGLETFTFNYSRMHDGHDDYIVIDNKTNSKDLTVTIGNLMYNMTQIQGAVICKPDPFVVPAGKAVELNVKILSQGSVCTCSVLQQQQEQQPQPVADSGISLYRMEVIADDIDYEQASDFVTTEIAKYDMTAQQINVKKWNPETKSYDINVDLEEFIHSIEDGTQVVDVCPDTENAMNVATNFLYGLYAMFDASLINYNSEKFPTECGFVFHSLKRVPLASTSFNPFVFTVKVYSNIQ